MDASQKMRHVRGNILSIQRIALIGKWFNQMILIHRGEEKSANQQEEELVDIRYRFHDYSIPHIAVLSRGKTLQFCKAQACKKSDFLGRISVVTINRCNLSFYYPSNMLKTSACLAASLSAHSSATLVACSASFVWRRATATSTASIDCFLSASS